MSEKKYEISIELELYRGKINCGKLKIHRYLDNEKYEVEVDSQEKKREYPNPRALFDEKDPRTTNLGEEEYTFDQVWPLLNLALNVNCMFTYSP